MRHADRRAGDVVHERERLLDQPRPCSDSFDEAPPLQEHEPGIGAHEQAVQNGMSTQITARPCHASAGAASNSKADSRAGPRARSLCRRSGRSRRSSWRSWDPRSAGDSASSDGRRRPARKGRAASRAATAASAPTISRPGTSSADARTRGRALLGCRSASSALTASPGRAAPPRGTTTVARDGAQDAAFSPALGRSPSVSTCVGRRSEVRPPPSSARSTWLSPWNIASGRRLRSRSRIAGAREAQLLRPDHEDEVLACGTGRAEPAPPSSSTEHRRRG